MYEMLSVEGRILTASLVSCLCTGEEAESHLEGAGLNPSSSGAMVVHL